MTDSLPRKLVKRIKGECLHCAAPMVEGSDYCEAHQAKVAEYGSSWVADKRQARADAGECITGCGAKVPRQRRDDGTVKLRRCKGCRGDHSKAMQAVREMRGVETAGCGVETASADPPRGRFKLETDARNDGWAASARYVGRDRRGAPSLEDKRRDALHSVDDARDLMARFDRACVTFEGPAVQELPRIQREAAREEVRDLLRRAARMLEDAAELYG